MNKYLRQYFTLGFLFTLYFPGVVFATASGPSWGVWFTNQINQHPQIVAAREKMNAALSMAEGRKKPRYNPELETTFEREGDNNNFRLGMSQTFDWWDKRDIRKRQADDSSAAVRQTFELIRQYKTAEALQTLIEWQAATKESELALQQESQMDTLIALITQRQQSGDLGQIDAELALLSLSQKLNATAQAQVRVKQSAVRLRELLPDWSPEQAWIPGELWSAKTTPTVVKWVDEHPVVIAAKADWSVLQKAAKLALLETKADPTLGVNAGKAGEENVVGLTFSMPLNIRNNYSAEARAANHRALWAEAEYRSIRRKQQFAIESSQATLNEFQQRYERLKTLMRGRGERSESLLQKQWHSGDMSTTEYLLALQQRTEGLIAGIELQTQFQLARIDWLLQTGQLSTVLIQLQQ